MTVAYKMSGGYTIDDFIRRDREGHRETERELERLRQRGKEIYNNTYREIVSECERFGYIQRKGSNKGFEKRKEFTIMYQLKYERVNE